MIEVLVALVVLGIGLLGIGKLVLLASRSNDSAYLRSQATELAYEILDDMRANRGQAVGGAYVTALGTGSGTLGFTCASAACTQANMAAYDVNVWKQHLAAALPSGQGSVVIANSASGPATTTATITVQWDDTVAQSSFGAVSYGTTSNVAVTLETII